MAPVSKRRKVAITSTTSSNVPSQQPQIRAFGKISKSAAAVPSIGKKARSTDLKEVDSGLATLKNTRKRRIGAVDENESVCGATQTPTKGARGLLETISFESTSSCPSSPQSHFFEEQLISSEFASRSTTPLSKQGSKLAEQLPQELQDLIDLHSSFLSALSLHFAHHSQDAPADLRCLTPTIIRLWKRRAVGLEDIRRILALAQSPPRDCNHVCQYIRLSLCDYGKGKLCIEIRRISTGKFGNRRSIEEKISKESFEENLRRRWGGYLDTFSQIQIADPSHFIFSLPLASIIVPKSVANCNPLLAKGQRRLEDLLRKPSQTPETSQAPSSHSFGAHQNLIISQPKPSLSRQSSLLSRIKAKETLQASLPAPPSLPEIQRKDALRRLGEIIPVFECLSSSHLQIAREGEVAGQQCTKLAPQTLSFSKSTLITNLRQSMGNPISKDDASRSIDVLAEMAPEWIAVRKIGKLESVTFRAMGGRFKGQLMEKIRLALGDDRL